jgi:hypothetical protein
MKQIERDVLAYLDFCQEWVRLIDIADATEKPRYLRFWRWQFMWSTGRWESYGAVTRLQRDGLINARWVEGANPPRREFHISRAGQRKCVDLRRLEVPT